MSEVRVVDLNELGVNREVFDKIYSMGEQDGRADVIDEMLQKSIKAIKDMQFHTGKAWYDFDASADRCIEKIEKIAEQLKEQNNDNK